MNKSFLFLLVMLMTCVSVWSQSENYRPVLTRIENGKIEGFYDRESGINKFLGIPYAESPVGELRWKAPQPKKKWEDVLETKSFGPSPVQTNVWGDMNYRSDSMSEDCLYLNIWTPTTDSSRKLPVLVYFYGGGLVAGDGSEPRYDGASMASKGIVALTVNYRLNIFGFFAHPELTAEAPYHASGNYGLLDQNAALRWVYRNIAAFGGDPERITIAGESAGSISVSSHMASPLSKDLLAGAIGESGAAINPTMSPVSLAEAEEIGVNFMRAAGYETLAELRALSTDKLFKLYKESKRFGFPSVIDGYFLTNTLPEIFESGKQAQIPLLIGWNSAEILGISFMQGLPYTEENYIQKVKETYPNNYEEVLKLYPSGSEQEVELSATALASDRFIAYSTWKWFDLQHNTCSRPVYRYLYCKKRPPLVNKNLISELAGGTLPKDEGMPGVPEPIGAPHACEIEYCMGNLHLIHEYAWTKEDYAVSETMHDYFANFIKTGNPNGPDLPKWPFTDPSADEHPVMLIDVKCKVVNSPYEERYFFLDKMYENRR